MPRSSELVAWASSDFCSDAVSAFPGVDRAENWVAASSLGVSVNDIGFRQGVVAVERLRTYDGRPVHLDRHLVRWRRTLDFLGIRLSTDSAEIGDRIAELIRRNRAWCEVAGEFGITMIATPGDATRPTEMMHLNPLDHAGIARHQTEGQPLVITGVCQPPQQSWPRDIKVRCRLHYYQADRIARQLVADALGVLVDADGSVTETSVANLAIVTNNAIWSPPPSHVLPGVTQEWVKQLATDLAFGWDYRPLYPADLRQADEVWLMGTDGGLWFADRVDGVPVGDGTGGRVYRKLLAAFESAVAGPF